MLLHPFTMKHLLQDMLVSRNSRHSNRRAHLHANNSQQLYDCVLGHTCNYYGCKNVLVIDGNMKNKRDICAATEAGYIAYEGLPGVIKTGCQQSPGYQSRYCYKHAPRSTRIMIEQQSDFKDGIVRLITAKKSTRGGTYYQVGCS